MHPFRPSRRPTGLRLHRATRLEAEIFGALSALNGWRLHGPMLAHDTRGGLAASFGGALIALAFGDSFLRRDPLPAALYWRVVASCRLAPARMRGDTVFEEPLRLRRHPRLCEEALLQQLAFGALADDEVTWRLAQGAQITLDTRSPSSHDGWFEAHARWAL